MPGMPVPGMPRFTPDDTDGLISLIGTAALGADLALRALKDEWADLGPRRHVVWPDGWRFIERRAT